MCFGRSRYFSMKMSSMPKAFAASLFGVDRASLSSDSAYGSIPAWDSVAHLRLVMAAEKRFGTHYPLETIPGLRTIRDFLV